jgi:predicted lipoprotein with Yx(FWY)xxD motif
MVRRMERLHTGDARQRVGGLLAVAALSVAALAASSLASSPPASARTASVKALTITTAHVPHVGTVLATSSGLTLYRWTVDPAGKATCTGACAKVWPPLLLPKGVTHIKAPHGVKGLSVARVAGGRLQVFFHHQALYGFVSDTKKGQATGQDVEKTWFAVLANGKPSGPATTPAATPAATTPGATTPGTTKASATTPTTTKPSGTSSTSPPSTSTSSPGSMTTSTTSPPVTKTTSPPATTPTTTRTTSPPPPPPTTTTTAPPTGGVAY